MLRGLSDTDKLIDEDRGDNSALVQILLDTQPKQRWLRRGIFTSLSERLEVPISQIYRILGMIRYAAQEISDTDRIIDKYGADKAALIQILLDIQQEKRWLSMSVLMCVSHRLGVPLSQVYQVATFSKAFSLIPRGGHAISVCLGTDCQTRGAPDLLDRVTQVLQIEPGHTSKDMRFSLDAGKCLGCCSIGPVMAVDGRYYSNPSTKEIKQIIASCK